MRFRAVAVAAVVALGFAAPVAAAAEPVGATPWFSRTWGVNNRVTALLPVGSDVIVGGSFSSLVGPSGATLPTSSLARWQPDLGQFAAWPVSVRGAVNAVVASGDVLYVGGDFNQVNGSARRNLAAVSLSTGALLPWSPDAYSMVESIALANGQIYVGGAFTDVGDSSGRTTANRLARFDAAGKLDRTWTGSLQANDRVRVILPTSDGGHVYVGGDFTSLNGSGSTSRLAKISTGNTAVVDSRFRAGSTNEGNRAPVYGLALSGNALLIGAGGRGGGCTRQDADSGRTIWSRHSNGNLQGVVTLGSMVYCVGHFSGSGSFDGLARNKIAEVGLNDGVVTAWAPKINSALGVWSVVSTPTRLVIGGDFTKVGTTLQPHVGEFRDRGAVGPPAPPLGVDAVPGDRKVALQWSQPDTDGGARLKRYDVLREDSPGQFVKIGDTELRSFTDTAVTNGKTYRYSVRSVSSAASGVLSQTASATPNAGLRFAPTAPTAFEGKGGSSAQLSWGPPGSDGGDPIVGYRVYRAVGGGGSDVIDQLGAGSRSHEDTNCPLKETCTYQVSAFNSVGEGPRTAAISVVGRTGIPATPELSASVGPGNTVNLSWTVSSSGAGPITRFIILRDAIRIATPSASSSSHKDAGVVRGKTYSYQVRAKNAYGISRNSDPVLVTVP